MRENIAPAMANLGSAVDYLEARSDVNSTKLATVGWCFGGGWAYQMAVNNIGVDASVMYYGQFDPQDDFANMRASILGHFGEEDSVIDVSNAREFKAKHENADQSSAVYIYPNVGHSFANYQGGNNLAYDPQAAETAWNRTLDFLENRLNQTGSESESVQTQNGATTTSTADNYVGPPESSADTTIRYTQNGFTPSEVTVTVGDTVRFINESGQSMWLASDEHPTREAHDGTSLQEYCGQQNSGVFDQCGVGDTYTFSFEKAGEWSYHNHEQAADGGTVTVR